MILAKLQIDIALQLKLGLDYFKVELVISQTYKLLFITNLNINRKVIFVTVTIKQF